MAEELNIESAVDSIASDIGLGGDADGGSDPGLDTGDTARADEGTDAAADDAPVTDSAPATDAPAKDAAAAAAPAAAAPTVRAAPASWAKEKHDAWAKLDPAVQEYIELREKQMFEGGKQYVEEANFGRGIKKAIEPYQDILRATGSDAPSAIRALFEAHKQLSNPDPAARAAYFQRMAAHYKVDPSAAQAAADEPAAVRELRERTERIEREHQQRAEAEARATRERVANEVTSFAEAKDEKGTPKHPYFDECWEDIVALIQAGHALDKAYEKAVYANPVTRAKEIARLQSETEASLRAKAKKEADDAKRGRQTNVNSKDTRRAPTASKTGNWEDTLTETLHDIKSRTH